MVLNRIKEFIDYKHISISAFEKSIGMSNASFGKSLKNKGAIGSDKLETILNIYSELSADWLLTGRGDMLRHADGESSLSQVTPTIIYKSDPKDIDIIELLRKQVAMSDKQIAMLEETVRSMKQQIARMNITDFTSVHSAEQYSDVAVVDTAKTAKIHQKRK